MSDAAAPAPAKKAAPKKPKAPAAHPKYSEMIKQALSTLKERGGSSRQAILKYIVKNFSVGKDEKSVNNHLKLALRAGVKNTSLKQSKGTGASGSFKIGVVEKPKVKKVVKPKKPAAAKKPKKAAAKPKKAAAKPKKAAAKSPKKAAAKPKKAPAKSPKKAAAKPKPKKAAPAKKAAAKPKKAAPAKKAAAKPKKAAPKKK